jgi:hypothetical protein
MSNETRVEAPLAATVGERLEEKAHQGDTTGVERAAAAVEDLREGGAGPERGAGERQDADRASHRARARSAARGSAVAWGVAAGLGAWVFAAMIGRAFRR